jgi:hypothetical protein
VSVLDRFKDGMSPEDMVLNLLSTVAHISEVEAHHALVLLKRDYAHELAEKQRAWLDGFGFPRTRVTEELIGLIDSGALNSEPS